MSSDSLGSLVSLVAPSYQYSMRVGVSPIAMLSAIRATRVLDASAFLEALSSREMFVLTAAHLPGGASEMHLAPLPADGEGIETWSVELFGSAGELMHGQGSLTRAGSAVVGRLQQGDSTFDVRADAAGALFIKPQTPAPPRTEAPPRGSPPSAGEARGAERRPDARPAEAAIDTCLTTQRVTGTSVRVGVAYASPRGDRVPDSVIAIVGAALVETNEAFERSAVRHRLTWSLLPTSVPALAVPENRNADDLLDDMRRDNRQLVSLDAWRDANSFDIVVLATRDPWRLYRGQVQRLCGYANMLPFRGDDAFAIVAIDCARDHATLAHEIGHVFGNDHHRAAKGRTPPAFPQYSFGFLDSVRVASGQMRHYGDLLAAGCFDDCRVRQYSRPGTYIELPPRAQLGRMPEPARDSGSDAARTIEQTGCTIAKLR